MISWKHTTVKEMCPVAAVVMQPDFLGKHISITQGKQRLTGIALSPIFSSNIFQMFQIALILSGNEINYFGFREKH